MNEYISTSPHSYVISYGMSREPFSEKVEDDLFYAEPTRKQKLDILLHLTQYGNELMLVTGPCGSGKTTLLQQFQLHTLDTWKVARIEARNGIDERKLVQQLFHQMGLEFHGATHAELLEHLEHHFDSLQHSARQAIMLIDDAEQLPVTALKCVLGLAGLSSKNNKPLLRIILFGTDKLEENFSDPLLEQYNSIVRRNIELPAFDKEQTAHYILHRLSAAHFAGNKPFTDSAMHKIHKQSHGRPGEINRLAHNLLLETSPSTMPDATGNMLSTFNLPRAIATVLGITVISALLFFQDDFNAWLGGNKEDKTDTEQQATTAQAIDSPTTDQTDNTLTAPGTNASETSAEAATASTPISPTEDLPADDPAVILAKMYGKKEPASESSIEADDADKAIPGTADAAPSSPSGATAKQASTAAAPIDESPAAPAARPATAKAVDKTVIESSRSTVATAPATTPVTTTPAVAATPSQPTSPGITTDFPGLRADWIQQQSPEHYTLQLVAGSNLKTLRDFIQQHAPTKPFAVYQSSRKGKPWFGLIHGVFSSKQQAIDARSRLPKALRRENPWVRKLEPLQKELRETALAP